MWIDLAVEQSETVADFPHTYSTDNSCTGELHMPRKKIHIKCPNCKKTLFIFEHSVNKAIKNTGFWNCKNCTLIRRNKKNAHPLWHIRIKKQDGRKQIKTKEGWKYLHVHIMESYLGRTLEKKECVHHCDNNKNNNKITNLELMTVSEHTIFHSTGRSPNIKTRKLMSDKKIGIPSKKRSLTYEIACKIRFEKKLSYQEIANKYNTSKSIVAHIKKNRSYAKEA